jgi:hypothetical protein
MADSAREEIMGDQGKDGEISLRCDSLFGIMHEEEKEDMHIVEVLGLNLIYGTGYQGWTYLFRTS